MEQTENIAQAHQITGEETDEQALSRRNFLKLGIGALSFIAAAEGGIVAFRFLQSRGQEQVFGDIVTVGPVDSFPAGTVIEFPEHRFFLIRAHDGGFLAVHNRCPHLGCTVYWASEKNHFVCPCHASQFDFYGDFESPPVPRPLDTFPVLIEDGIIQVDTSKLQQRKQFTPEQLAYA
jgi:nitrite reductase/ring-hydroxylating ferredoxin subunit